MPSSQTIPAPFVFGPPNWAGGYGQDRYGYFADLTLLSGENDRFPLTQRFRWVPPGEFSMGSPEDEHGRDDDERQHRVTLTQGFWLADTACTQEMWQAVMGDDPSYFKGAQRPVEQVSYNDVLGFCQRLNERFVDGLFRLPTEAEWEYACRAGTTTPFSFGETITVEQANFDGNYPYRSGDAKGEYRAETVEVKALDCNAWGLYQMHGNVWEWCQDWQGDYPKEDVVDPVGPDTGSCRVLRGGSWFYDARYVRSAFRYWHAPGDRNSYLGFRLLSSAASGAEPIEGAEEPVAEQGPERTPFGGADERLGNQTIRLVEQQPVTIRIPALPSLHLLSNREEIELQRRAKPDWAVDFGQDHCGIYADFIVESRKQPPARQRLRWIPPGRFLMGSPENEVGRYDNETQHPVTISRGFWMFDTPCSQSLWIAVMDGKNPSYFDDPNRPVESVSWSECMEFADALTELMRTRFSNFSELTFSLPTEAQWEYACRAGTSTAIYSGSLEILGDANAPALDDIAWYAGNCGHDDFDHPKGQTIDWATDKQYEFEKGGTRKLKQKQPNSWGLYDMLGNVHEWCHDYYGDYETTAVVDPMGPEKGSARVQRGGGWFYYARDVRSAYRYWYAPGVRVNALGFRLLSSAGSSE